MNNEILIFFIWKIRNKYILENEMVIKKYYVNFHDFDQKFFPVLEEKCFSFGGFLGLVQIH